MLFGSTMLEVAIGMAFVYVLLSLICSAVNEWIAGILGLRAKFLDKGIKNLLDDPIINQLYNIDLVKEFYKHPLIQGLTDKERKQKPGDGSQPTADESTGKPSYIPTQTFARVLIDLVPKAGDNPSGNNPRSLLEIYQAARATLTNPSLKESKVAKTLLMLIDEAGVDSTKATKASTTQEKSDRARTALLNLAENSGAHTPNAESLRALVDNITGMEANAKQMDAEVKVALQKAQQNIENYFDEAMERVSGWYKRRVQLIIVVLGLVVTILLNVDSFAIAHSLITNPNQRALIVELASQNQANLTAAVEQSKGANAINATATTSDTQGVDVTAGLVPTTTLPVSSTQAMTTTAAADPFKLLQGLGLPMGWKKPLEEGKADAAEKEWIWKDWRWWDWSVKVIGLLITTAAIAMGAPFWFDLLGKLLNVRMAGKKPEKTTPPTALPAAG